MSRNGVPRIPKRELIRMIRTYTIGSENYLDERLEPVIVVEIYTKGDEGEFDEEHCKTQAELLKQKSGAAAVVLQHGGKFWVV